MPPKQLKKRKQKMKGKPGTLNNFCTRTSALRKTQLKLSDFRKICIIKGIYPRVPKTAFKGPDKSYYHMKDMASINRDDLVGLLRKVKVMERKKKKHLHRGEMDIAKRIQENTPYLSYHSVIKERYSTLVDALRDLDDCISTIALFAYMPTDSTKPSDTVACVELMNQFCCIVSRYKLMNKAFISIKGYYLTAEILGVQITWIEPHRFKLDIPEEVDLKILSTFLDFYIHLFRFVNFKLYKMANLHYPPNNINGTNGSQTDYLAWSLSPPTNSDKKDLVEEDVTTDNHGTNLDHSMDMGSGLNDDAVMTSVADVTVNNQDDRGSGLAQLNDSPFDLKYDTSDEKATQATEERDLKRAVFKDLVFFIHREVPMHYVSLLILCGGGKVVCEDEATLQTPYKGIEDETITHHVIDRNTEQLNQLFGQSNTSLYNTREFIQPQWVFDTFNAGRRMPAFLYAPDCVPPPHLSPYTDGSKSFYSLILQNPEYRKALLDHKAKETTDSEVADAKLDDDFDSYDMNMKLAKKWQMHIENEVDNFQKNVNASSDLQSTISSEPNNYQHKKSVKVKKEELSRKMMMMSKRRRKLYKELKDKQPVRPHPV